MTAKEKFEARLNFLGLADEWSEIGGTGSVGTFDPYGNIIVLIHLSNDDEYSEIRYPSYASLRENDKFVDVCAHKCVTLDNDLDFATKTARWLLRITDECPLDAVDAYTILEDYGFNEYYEDFEDDLDVIMTTLQNHNEHLVSQINEKWGRFKERFKPILCALYQRDIDEITGADSFQFPDWEDWDEFKHGLNTGDWSGYNKKALASLIENWDAHVGNYLMHVADDQDLKTILTFVRYDVCEETGRDRILYGTSVTPVYLDGSPWTRCDSYEELEKYLGKDAMTEEDEKYRKWWLVGKFSDGNLWMNNQEGCCYLESNTNLNLYYARFF